MFRKLKVLRWLFLLLLAGMTTWLAIAGTQLHRHAQQPVDTVLVLGGSIRREIYIAEFVAQGSRLPILISQGSQPPCIRILFERVAAPLDTTWLENCADSTFDNYRYSLPILKQWGAQHIQVVTSQTHLPRAQWLAQIILGSHGIWVDMTTVDETGVPANVESPVKTGLDVVRSLGWAVISHFYQPQCNNLLTLDSVDLADWEEKGFKCEHQAGIETPGKE